MNYHNITKEDMLNGDGLRVVLWVAGCNHHCKDCQNPITWDPNGGILFDMDAKKEIFDELDKDYISGITFSGGDPLHENNRQSIEALITIIKNTYPEKTIWLYTGYTWEQVIDLNIPFLKHIDVLVDGRFVTEEKDNNLKWKGSPNQRVINVKKSLEIGEVVLHCK